MFQAELVAALVVNSIHFFSCMFIILLIYKTNKFKDIQEQLLALQNLAELLYQSLNILNTAPCVFGYRMPAEGNRILTVTGNMFLTASFQLLALLAVILTISITRASKYRQIVTNGRMYKLLAFLLALNIFMSMFFFIPGTESRGHISHSETEENEDYASASVGSNVFYVVHMAYQILPPLVFESASFYKMWRFVRHHTTEVLSPRVAMYMKRAKFILAVCIVIHVSYIPHKVFDSVLTFAHGTAEIMHVVAMSSTFLPSIYNVSKLPVFLLCCKSYRMTLNSMICNTKHSSSISPSSTI